MLKTIVNPSNGLTLKFGRIISTRRSRGFSIERALNLTTLPSAPASYDWSAGPALNPDGLENILGNGDHGDCCLAGAAHIIEQTLAASGNPYAPITEDQVFWAYSQVTQPPFNPATGANDSGCDETIVLDWWRDHGFLEDGSHKILGWANVDPSNQALVSSCAWLFENLYLGMALPDVWLNPVPSGNGFTWNTAGDPDPQNGHCVVAAGFDQTSGLKINSWGLLGTLTWAALAKYCAGPTGELHVVLTEDAINKASLKAPTGFDRDHLLAYLQAA